MRPPVAAQCAHHIRAMHSGDLVTQCHERGGEERKTKREQEEASLPEPSRRRAITNWHASLERSPSLANALAVKKKLRWLTWRTRLDVANSHDPARCLGLT